MDHAKILIIGGVTNDSAEDWLETKRVCKLLGQQLGRLPQYKIVVCSAHPSSADSSVLEGFAESSSNQEGQVIIHRPIERRLNLRAGESITEQWDSLIQKTKLRSPQIRDNSSVIVSTDQNVSDAFLLTQIRALKEDTDIIIAIGGRPNASAAPLLAFARGTYPVIPFAFLGGAGREEFVRQEAALRCKFEDSKLLDALQSPDGINQIEALIKQAIKIYGRYHVFMSYAWNRKQEADYVEAFLRRYPGISIFRDEIEIKQGEAFTDRIKEQLLKCDIFLVMWCAEYATSPHCYDEFTIASERKDCLKYILRLDETRPVWPKLRKDNSHDWKGKWNNANGREGITNSLNEMLQIMANSKK